MKKGRMKGKFATFEDYKRFFDTEHLRKFSPAEVGFQNPSAVQHFCRDCYHWFVNQVSGWTPCEIMTLGQKKAVPSSGVCRFWTNNGKTYPLVDRL